MFTGIVQATGSLESRERRGPGFRVKVRAPFSGLQLGESIAVNGVCLTVTEDLGHGFSADISSETSETTTLGGLELGDSVNLERALAVGDRLGGHYVSGHVDAVCKIAERATVGDAERFRIRAPAELMRLIAAKGSICLDGVSLTVNAVRGNAFDIMLVPHTLSNTTLEAMRPGHELNLEVDLLARYVERCLGKL